jgi:hypothetical protein
VSKSFFLNSRVKEGATLTYTLEILEDTTLRPQRFKELSTSIAQSCRSSWGPSGPKIPSGPSGVENGCISLEENAQWWRNMLSLHKECSQIAKPCMSTSQRYSSDPILERGVVADLASHEANSSPSLQSINIITPNMQPDRFARTNFKPAKASRRGKS